jgi:hypothetical protein
MSDVPISARFRIKRHAGRPHIRVLVKNSDRTPFDFTGATRVNFLMYDRDGLEKVNAAGGVESPLTSGYLRYEWQDGDTDTAGEFTAEFEVSYSTGNPLVIPLDSVLGIFISEDLNDE